MASRKKKMTEAEWLRMRQPDETLWRMEGRFSERKLRLFACACCRRLWSLLTEHAQETIRVAELFAEGRVGIRELRSLVQKLEAGAQGDYPPEIAAVAFASRVTELVPLEVYDAVISAQLATDVLVAEAAGAARRKRRNSHMAAGTALANEKAYQCALLKDIFGNPFRPTFVDPAWLTRNSGVVATLAQTIAKERAFDLMLVLADALEESGCTDQAVLEHCRSGGEHVLGCWIVDLLLGKE